MIPQKFINALHESVRDSAAIIAATQKVKTMSKAELVELKASGSKFEKPQAELELRVRAADESIPLLMKKCFDYGNDELFLKELSDGLENQLNKIGYKLVGHIEKIKP